MVIRLFWEYLECFISWNFTIRHFDVLEKIRDNRIFGRKNWAISGFWPVIEILSQFESEKVSHLEISCIGRHVEHSSFDDFVSHPYTIF